MRQAEQVLFLALFLLCAFVLSVRLITDMSDGGESWLQGDWLINSIETEIRRGPLGSAIIHVSDFLEINPVWAVGVFQAVCTAAFLTLSYIEYRRAPDPLFRLLLIASPAVFVLFWAGDPQGGFRKEILAYLGIAAMTTGLRYRSTPVLIASTAVLIVAFVGHEANVLFIPFVCLMLYASGLLRDSPRVGWICFLAIVLGGALAAAFAIMNSSVPSSSLICDPLLARGVEDHVCGGSIAWLETDIHFALREVQKRIVISGQIYEVATAYLLAALPFLYVACLADRSLVWIALLLALGLPFALLYPVAGMAT